MGGGGKDILAVGIFPLTSHITSSTSLTPGSAAGTNGQKDLCLPTDQLPAQDQRILKKKWHITVCS